VEVISFGGEGLAADLIPVDELADCAATALALDGNRILSYGTGAGYTPLRELLAERLGVHPFRVVLTPSWLQGFRLLIATRVRGHSVIVEYPTNHRALQAFFTEGVNVLYVDWQGDGPNLDLLMSQLQGIQRPALAYLMPTFHNPTGRVLTRDDRWRLGSLLHRRQILTLEDDSYGLLRFEGEPVQTLFELSARTMLYSTSFAATIAPGLGVGVFVLPEALAGELARRANDTFITPPLLAQATVFEFLRRGRFEPHLVQLNDRLRARRDAMLDALDRHFGDAAVWSRPQGGMFVLLELPPGTDAKEVLARAEGVEARAGIDIHAVPNAVRLNFAGVEIGQIEPGIERLAAALKLSLV
jgi:2-aminoadipate transaminase